MRKKAPESTLDAPPPHPVLWVGEHMDGRKVLINTKLWYGAVQLAHKHFGHGPISVRRQDPGERVDGPVIGDAPKKRLISVMDFMLAPPFTVFKGPALECGIGDGWDMFSISGTTPDGEVRREANRRGIVVAHDIDGFWLEPEWDSDVLDGDHPAANDDCAALAYLNEGGRLVKLPDTMNSSCYRLYPVVHVRR
jgi:hypothetical protein